MKISFDYDAAVSSVGCTNAQNSHWQIATWDANNSTGDVGVTAGGSSGACASSKKASARAQEKRRREGAPSAAVGGSLLGTCLGDRYFGGDAERDARATARRHTRPQACAPDARLDAKPTTVVNSPVSLRHPTVNCENNNNANINVTITTTTTTSTRTKMFGSRLAALRPLVAADRGPAPLRRERPPRLRAGRLRLPGSGPDEARSSQGTTTLVSVFSTQARATATTRRTTTTVSCRTRRTTTTASRPTSSATARRSAPAARSPRPRPPRRRATRRRCRRRRRPRRRRPRRRRPRRRQP